MYTKAASVVLAFLCAISLGVGVADIVYTSMVVCENLTDKCPLGSAAIVLAWIASGIWASLFGFITAIFGLRYASDPINSRQMFMTICFMSAVLFLPAMTVINGVATYMITQDSDLFESSDPASGNYFLKFLLPVIIASLGLIEFFIAAALLIKVCTKPISYDEMDDDDDTPAAQQARGQTALGGAVSIVPTQVAMNAPGLGYYYPSRIYQLPARTPGFQTGAVGAAGYGQYAVSRQPAAGY